MILQTRNQIQAMILSLIFRHFKSNSLFIGDGRHHLRGEIIKALPQGHAKEHSSSHDSSMAISSAWCSDYCGQRHPG
jgi:hypothetical protein